MLKIFFAYERIPQQNTFKKIFKRLWNALYLWEFFDGKVKNKIENGDKH